MRIVLVTSLFALLLGFLMQAPFAELQKNERMLKENAALQANVLAAENSKATLFSSLPIEAKSAIVREYPSGKIIFSKNATERYPLASLAKLMTALTLQDVEQYKTSPFPLVVPITQSAIRQDGDSGFAAGEKFYFDDLIDIMLVNSSNDAAYALASFAGNMFSPGSGEAESINAFLLRMDQKKEALGLSDFYFSNVTGLDIDEVLNVSGAYGSAGSVARLLGAFLSDRPFLLERTQRDTLTISSASKTHTFKNSNTLAVSLPGLRASKTGFTDVAGGNLAIAIDAGLGHTVIIVVMGSSFDGRFSDVEMLYNAAVEYYKQ